MGHISAKTAYGQLQDQLNRLPVGAPGEGTIHEILKILFTPEEAELVARMPLRFTRLETIARKVGLSETTLRVRLEALAEKGLVFDLLLGKTALYIPNPTVVGFFEFSMMRIRDDIDQKKLAGLFHHYLIEEPDFARQFKEGTTVTPFRTLVHEDALPENYAEVLDWERANHLVREARKWAKSICHCRHVAHHQGRDCKKLPMDVCLILGQGVRWVQGRGIICLPVSGFFLSSLYPYNTSTEPSRSPEYWVPSVRRTAPVTPTP